MLASETDEFSLADEADLFTITCNYNVQTGLSTFGFSLNKANPGDPDPDPALTITYQPYDLYLNPLTPIAQNTYAATFANQAWRSLEVTFTRPDGATGTARAECNTSQVQPAITTQPTTGAGAIIPQMGQVPVGTALRDTATMTGQTTNAGGSATYRLYKGDSCTGTPVYEVTVPVTNGVIPNSPTPGYAPPNTVAGQGVYNWQVSYSGDTLNKAATSQCGLETLIVGKMQSSISTTMRSGNSVVGQNGNIYIDQSITDQATLSNVTGAAGGTVTFRLYAGDCTGAILYEETVAVSNGAAGQTTPHGPLPIGVYNWVVVYSGDSLNEAVTSPCGAETFNVVKRQPSVTTQTKNATTNANINDGATVSIGTSILDTATMSGMTSDASGTVTYYLWAGDGCDIGSAIWSATVNVVNGVIQNSPAAMLPGGINPFNTPGVYNFQAVYSGDARNTVGSSLCGSETVNVGKNSPSIATVMRDSNNAIIAQNAVIPLPNTVHDTSTLSGAAGTPTGTVTYRLYKGFLCNDSTLVYTSPALPLNPDGTLPDSPAVPITNGGTYNWVAEYSGDAANNATTGTCGHEQFHAGQGSGGITTTPKKTNASGGAATNVADDATIPVMSWVADTSTMSGFTPDRSGTITYNLYLDADCTGTPVYSSTVSVVAAAAQPQSGHFQVAQTGRYEWQAVYSGDANNSGAVSACGSETFYVNKIATTTVTAMKASGGTSIADNTSVLLPFDMYDTAVVNGTVADVELTGTIEYRLYPNTGCTGTPTVFGPFTITGGVVPDMTGLATLTQPIAYNWRAYYSGNNVYAESTSACGGETVFGQVQPTISTGPRAGVSSASQQAIGQNASVAIGTWVSDTSTLANASAYQSRLDGTEPRATVTYRLYAGESCTGTPIFTSTKTVTSNSNSMPASDAVQLNYSGTYNWQATYSGNRTNLSAVSECGLERFIVEPAAPTLTTVMRHGPSAADQSATLVQDSYQQLPRFVSDTATLIGVPFGTTGTLTYQLFLATDTANPCGGTPVHTSTHSNVTNLSSLPASSAFNATQFGTYNWVVTFQPDAPDSEPIVSGCGEETFIGVEEFQRNVTISCTYTPASGTSTFGIVVSKETSTAPDYDPALEVIVFPFALDNAPLSTITYHNYDSGIGPNNPNLVQQPWRRIRVEVTWPSGETGTALAGCNPSKLTPSIATIMVDSDSEAVENGSVLAIGDQIGDTVQLTGATVDFGGYFEYRLYNSADCSGEPVFTSLKSIPQPGGSMPASSLHTILAAGDYNWRVFYSGDIYNNSVTSACNTEFFTVSKNPTSITTTVMVGETIVPQDGTVAVGASVFDTAVLTGATSTAGGTVTYELFDSADCSGEAVATFVKNVVDGVVEDSDPFVVQAGKTYNWVVTYGGDANNDGSISECGSETFVTPLLRITKVNSSGSDVISAGGTISFTIQLTNAGPGVALGASISDALPAASGLTWTLVAGSSSANCAVNAGTLECDARDLEANESITAVVTSPASSEACGPVNNTADYDSENAGSGTSEEATVEIACADVELVKRPDAGTVYPGETAEFTITVTNLGPGTSTGVVVEDTLPAGDWTVEVDPSTLAPTINAGVLTLNIGDMAEDDVVTITLSRVVTVDDCGPITNEASVSATNEPEDALDNNTDDAQIDVLCTELELIKTPDNGENYPGETATFTIVVSNVGSNLAKDVEIVETLPPGPWTVTTDPVGLEQELVGNQLTVTVGDLGVEGQVTITLSRTVTTEDCGVINNEATVGGSNEFPESEASAPNTDNAQIDVLCTELELIKTPDEGEVYPGETATFMIVVTNLGPNLAKNVEIVETLPPGSWTVTTDPVGLAQELVGNQLTVTVGDLESEAQVTITISREVSTDDCGSIENTATVSGGNEFPINDESRPNVDTGSFEVLCTDIQTVKSPKSATVNPGGLIEFSIVVSNIGESVAKDVVIIDALPTGFPAGSWTITTNPSGLAVTTPYDVMVRVEAGDIPVGGSVTLTLTRQATTDDCGSIQNVAWSSASNEIPGTSLDNLDYGDIQVTCSNISIRKSPDFGRINAGENAVFTIEATSFGAYPAVGVQITDTLPAGEWTISVVDVPDGVTVDCGNSPASGSFTCDVQGEWKAITMIRIVVSRPTTSADCSTLVNVASITSTNELPDQTSDNQDSGDITVVCPTATATSTPEPTATSTLNRRQRRRRSRRRPRPRSRPRPRPRNRRQRRRRSRRRPRPRNRRRPRPLNRRQRRRRSRPPPRPRNRRQRRRRSRRRPRPRSRPPPRPRNRRQRRPRSRRRPRP
ncbi:MAG: hypothetical protein R2843_11360 [Thermomicrobiales bacterium]